ncbi:hypothetical protein PR048_016344 [Dryococelus australis]|uniref:Tc1-like transposase DDE domain-containing protein n=1 Tax=Dryococelus australis TaxID=614101 RepID=A0ABQ9HJG5_9NEOP|nr:hypothetical protein PR048_016344 [Dryococelus australis]
MGPFNYAIFYYANHALNIDYNAAVFPFTSSGVIQKSWQDGTLFICKHRNLDQGKRFIVFHAGSEQGSVESVGVVSAPCTNVGDYHGTLNAEKFEQWLAEQVLSIIKGPAVIVLDNAYYRSVQVEKLSTSSWLKAELPSWLTKKGIPHSASDTHRHLYELAKLHRDDQIITDAGHIVLRLPPYHCYYNPIELVWSDCKRFFYNYTGRGNRFDEEAVWNTWCEALCQVTPENSFNILFPGGKTYVPHTERLIVQESVRELRIDSRMAIQPVVIELRTVLTMMRKRKNLLQYHSNWKQRKIDPSYCEIVHGSLPAMRQTGHTNRCMRFVNVRYLLSKCCDGVLFVGKAFNTQWPLHCGNKIVVTRTKVGRTGRVWEHLLPPTP